MHSILIRFCSLWSGVLVDGGLLADLSKMGLVRLSRGCCSCRWRALLCPVVLGYGCAGRQKSGCLICCWRRLTAGVLLLPCTSSVLDWFRPWPLKFGGAGVYGGARAPVCWCGLICRCFRGPLRGFLMGLFST